MTAKPQHSETISTARTQRWSRDWWSELGDLRRYVRKQMIGHVWHVDHDAGRGRLPACAGEAAACAPRQRDKRGDATNLAKSVPPRGCTASHNTERPNQGHHRKGIPMTTIASPSSGARPSRGRRLAAATLFAAALALGAAWAQPAIAAAAPPVTPTPRPVPPGAPLTPALPPRGPGAGAAGGWDIEAYDACVAQEGETQFCCESSGGVWNAIDVAGHRCSAPPARREQ
jgi:hypothetical protein